MSQAASGSSRTRATVPPSSNVYTVLVVVAAVALAIGCGYLWVKNTSLTGQSNPFYIEPAPSTR